MSAEALPRELLAAELAADLVGRAGVPALGAGRNDYMGVSQKVRVAEDELTFLRIFGVAIDQVRNDLCFAAMLIISRAATWITPRNFGNRGDRMMLTYVVGFEEDFSSLLLLDLWLESFLDGLSFSRL